LPYTFPRIAVSATIVLAIIIAYLALTPVPNFTLGKGDKVNHIAAFAALIFVTTSLYPVALKWILPSAILFGGMIEIVQPYFGRTRDIEDFFADLVGLAIGMLIGRGLRKLPLFLARSQPTRRGRIRQK